jgi:hypothetical protein
MLKSFGLFVDKSSMILKGVPISFNVIAENPRSSEQFGNLDLETCRNRE